MELRDFYSNPTKLGVEFKNKHELLKFLTESYLLLGNLDYFEKPRDYETKNRYFEYAIYDAITHFSRKEIYCNDYKIIDIKDNSKYNDSYTIVPFECIEFPKMALHKFWEANQPIAVNCKTIQEAKLFCDLSHKLNKKWVDNSDYSTNKTYWEFYMGNTCYGNNRRFNNLENIRDYIYIINFSDLDLDGTI